jgi:mRNA interferase RelE/StbE
MYKLVVPRDVRELIRTMHPSLKKKVKTSLKIILSEPYSGKTLMEELSGLRSFRVSSFRIIYRIKEPEQIELVVIGPRERIYEETFRMIQKRLNEAAGVIHKKVGPDHQNEDGEMRGWGDRVIGRQSHSISH